MKKYAEESLERKLNQEFLGTITVQLRL